MAYVTYPVIVLIGFSCCDTDKAISAFKNACIALNNSHEDDFNEYSVKEHSGSKGGAVFVFAGGHNYFGEQDAEDIANKVLEMNPDVEVCECVKWLNENQLSDIRCERWERFQ